VHYGYGLYGYWESFSDGVAADWKSVGIKKIDIVDTLSVDVKLLKDVSNEDRMAV
jgi:hypothetical protein